MATKTTKNAGLEAMIARTFDAIRAEGLTGIMEESVTDIANWVRRDRKNTADKWLFWLAAHAQTNTNKGLDQDGEWASVKAIAERLAN